MKKLCFVLLAMMAVFSVPTNAQVVASKVVDNGGTGMFKAIAVKDAAMPDFVIYRPKDMMHAHAREGALPLLMFGNGGCMDTSVGYERMLTEIASHGYVVVAIGELEDSLGARPETHTAASELKRGMETMLQLAETRGSDYYNNIDTARIAAAGHSCGGAQVLANCADPRIKTCLILNAGMGDMEMAGASRASLAGLHAPTLYIVGGPSDVAYRNAQLDYDRIHHVPVCLADHPASGHGGTYWDPYGGDYGRLVLDWLDWQLKGKRENADIFLNSNLKDYDGWTIKAKNFRQRPGRVVEATMPCSLLQGVSQRVYDIYLPGSYDTDTERTYPVLYLLHGGGESHTVWQRNGQLREVADSLIDCNEAEEMIIVCAEGNENNMMYFNAPQWRYEDFFFKEFIPYIEKTYRAKATRDTRAIGGFSMGGGCAVVYGVHHPEMFSMVYDISGYLRRQQMEWLRNDPSASWRQRVIEQNNPIKRVLKGSNADVANWQQVDWFVCVGDQDFTLEANMDFVKALRQRGISYQFRVGSGNHNWLWVKPAMTEAIKRASNNFRKAR